MSYSRFSFSDIYLYLDVDGYFSCCCCRLAPKHESGMHHDCNFYSVKELFSHLDAHNDAGHDADYDGIKKDIMRDVRNNNGKMDTRLWPEFRHIKNFPDLPKTMGRDFTTPTPEAE